MPKAIQGRISSMKRIFNLHSVAILAAICSLGLGQLKNPDHVMESDRQIQSSNTRPSYIPSEEKKILDLEITPIEVGKYGVQELSIIATKNGFFPSKIILRKNIPTNIHLAALTSQKLCFILKNRNRTVRRGISSREISTIKNLRFMDTGLVKFYCPIDNIEGEILVVD